MQCPACRAVYSNGLGFCPRCRTPGCPPPDPTKLVDQSPVEELALGTNESASAELILDTAVNEAPIPSSTLLEFPRAGRTAHPPWRKELSERVREIQERRAREAAIEAANAQRQLEEQPLDEPGGMPLGLVLQPDQPALNPLVIAALKRIERAQQPAMPKRTSSRRGASVAFARVAEQEFEVGQQVETQPSHHSITEPKIEIAPAEQRIETPRPRTLTVVQPKVASTVVVDDAISLGTSLQPAIISTLEAHDPGAMLPEEFYDDYAPLFSRFVAGLIDLSVVVFASSPFAAIIELSNGDWTDDRVLASMGGIVVIITFLYLTSSTALAGRTWGMSLLSLRAVDVDTGLPPTTRQSLTRAIAYMLSLATLGVGLLYAVVDAEGRGVHDHVSGTTVVRE